MTKEGLRMIILALMVLGGLSMCSKNEVVADEEDPWTDLCGDQRIRFSSSLSVTATKADLPDNTTFAVFAWYTGQDPWSASTRPNFMYNEDVFFDGSTYTYAPIKYWPNNPDDKVSFWSYCPYNAAGLTLREGIGESGYSNTSTTGIPYLDFNVCTGNGSVDLMVADFEDDDTSEYWTVDHTKPSIDSPVNFLFHHLLCKVNFFFRLSTDGIDVNLTQIRFDHVYETGIYDCETGWNNISGDVSLTAFSGTLPLSYYSDTSPDSVMLLPQTLADPEVNLHIVYTVDDIETIGNIVLSTKHESWEVNNQYNYTITISPSGNPIIFSASIRPWTDDAGYVTIVK